MAKILIVDDEEKICFAFKEFVKELGHDAFTASTAPDAMEKFHTFKPEIIFLDIRLPGESGISLLKKIKQMDRKVSVVIMTAFSTMDTTIDAVKLGAYEYLTKPVDLDQVEDIIKRILRPRETGNQRLFCSDEINTPVNGETIIGKTDAIADIYKMIGLLTTNDVPVLIEGESGVGKELVARAIHNKSSKKQYPFVAINCGAMPDNLLETELFGHEKGAFTGAENKKIGKFEYAENGTLFLDEIGDLKFPLQVKLLRVLQEKNIVRIGGLKSIPVNARIITATNKDLLAEMKAGRFRSDLFYRLQLITLRIPPLRERKEDIPALCCHFIKKSNIEMNKNIRGIENDAMDIILNHDWPGNVRELENVIKRGMILSRGDTIGSYSIEITKSDLETEKSFFSSTVISENAKEWFRKRAFLDIDQTSLFSAIISEVEKELIRQALELCSNNQVKTAEVLGMNRTTLRNKIKEYCLG